MQKNRRGRTSHENFTGLFAKAEHFNEQTDQVWGFHLGWSGNHQLRADVKSDGRRFVPAGEFILQAQERYTTPRLYACYSDTGLNASQLIVNDYISRSSSQSH